MFSKPAPIWSASLYSFGTPRGNAYGIDVAGRVLGEVEVGGVVCLAPGAFIGCMASGVRRADEYGHGCC